MKVLPTLCVLLLLVACASASQRLGLRRRVDLRLREQGSDYDPKVGLAQGLGRKDGPSTTGVTAIIDTQAASLVATVSFAKVLDSRGPSCLSQLDDKVNAFKTSLAAASAKAATGDAAIVAAARVAAGTSGGSTSGGGGTAGGATGGTTAAAAASGDSKTSSPSATAASGDGKAASASSSGAAAASASGSSGDGNNKPTDGTAAKTAFLELTAPSGPFPDLETQIRNTFQAYYDEVSSALETLSDAAHAIAKSDACKTDAPLNTQTGKRDPVAATILTIDEAADGLPRSIVNFFEDIMTAGSSRARIMNNAR